MKTHTETLAVYASQYCGLTPQNFADMQPGMAAQLMYAAEADYWPENGYTKVGTAEITLTMLASDTMIANKVDALRAEKKKVQAEAAKRANDIDGQIQNLLAITYIPQAADLAAAAGDDGVTEDDPDFPEVPADDVVDAEFDPTCNACDGTGEGAFDGQRCQSCNGKGTTV